MFSIVVHIRVIGLGRMSNSSNRNGDDEAQEIAHAASDLPSPLSRQLHCPGKFDMMTRLVIVMMPLTNRDSSLYAFFMNTERLSDSGIGHSKGAIR